MRQFHRRYSSAIPVLLLTLCACNEPKPALNSAKPPQAGGQDAVSALLDKKAEMALLLQEFLQLYKMEKFQAAERIALKAQHLDPDDRGAAEALKLARSAASREHTVASGGDERDNGKIANIDAERKMGLDGLEKRVMVAQLLQDFKRLCGEGKYQDAHQVALKAQEIDPNDPGAAAAAEMSRLNHDH